MKIKGKLTFKTERANEIVNIIAQTLSPDNVPEMETCVSGDCATVVFTGDKVGTVLSSIDDFLMNAKIANDILLQKY